MTSKNEKFGVFNFGFIENNSTFIHELNSILEGTSQKAEFRAFNIAFFNSYRNGELKYLDKFGNKNEENKGNYALYFTGYKDKSNQEIIAYFHRYRTDRNWTGIFYATETEIKKEIKKNLLFRIGKITFDNWNDGFDFLEELNQTTIPEKWSYQNHVSPIPYPILKSYIENIFEKLLKVNSKDNLLIDDKGGRLLFNSGLLDRFFHDIYIAVEIKDEAGEKSYWNPSVMKSLSDLTKTNFTSQGKLINNPDDLPKTVNFFNDINEVIFQYNVPIDRNYSHYSHIIDERRDRFPDEYQGKDTTLLARTLDNSINYAIAIAKRNYKLIVPQYRPQGDKIQLLMPIYLSGIFSAKPDFALVLDLENNIYTPETILPLDAAYQNARLIAKPDSFWLNPDDI